MSKTSSPTETDELKALRAELGGDIIRARPDDVAAVQLVLDVRGRLIEAARQDGVGVRELARRLRVSASAISRQLRGDGDMRIGTAAILADALGREWKVELRPIAHAQHPAINFHTVVTSDAQPATLPQTARDQAAHLVMEVTAA